VTRGTKNLLDMVSTLEISKLTLGDYTLRISVPKDSFIHSSKFTSCLKFDFFFDFEIEVPPREGVVPVLSVLPRNVDHLKVDSVLELELNFNSDAPMKDLSKTLIGEYKICMLKNSAGNWLKPATQFYRERHAILNFSFAADADRIMAEGDQCFSLVCDSVGELTLQLPEWQTKYCFDKNDTEAVNICNPFSEAKYENEQCICAFPYTGKYCE